MATNVQSDNTAVLNVPPEAVELIFADVLQRLMPRKGIVQDNVVDGIDNA
jgi:hypothetical protein